MESSLLLAKAAMQTVLDSTSSSAAPKFLTESVTSPAPLILVVDDNQHSREGLMEFLVESGYRVTAAADGLEALQKAERRRPNLVLLDLAIPLLDGWTVAKRLSSEDKFGQVPVVGAQRHGLSRRSSPGAGGRVPRVHHQAVRSRGAGSDHSRGARRRVSEPALRPHGAGAGAGWHFGHQYVVRAPSPNFTLTIGVPQRRHGRRARPYTHSRAAGSLRPVVRLIPK